MPLYEYQCTKCGRQTERIEKVAGPHLKKCPHCGGKVERLLSKPAIQFKGSGWYVTDYAGKSGKSEADTATASADAKDASAKDATSKDSTSKEAPKDAKRAEEKKPAKKK